MAAHSAAPFPDYYPEAFPSEQEKAPLYPRNPEEQQQQLPSEVKEEQGARGSELDPREVARRLEKTRRELSNRRKILIRNLPQDSSSQEVHDLLKDYELKYCYVDRNKRTAFVTLLDGEQAQDAIQKLHQYSLRGNEITVQLQPTDALLCVTNLDPSFTFEEFEDLIRAYGNIERCFLVYSEVTGHSKGYGFVEYMKKDSAAKARVELLGRPLGESTLFAQWMDVNQLTADLIHSKCLCVSRIPKDYNDSEELLQAFSSLHKPVFCQFAQDEGSYFGGFAVIEYETAEQAEAVKDASNGLMLRGSPVRVSFCAPGAAGRSTLAALIAAQGMMQNCKKGLLPEPNAVQIMKSFSNPAMLQMLQPQLQMHGGKPVLAVSPGMPCFVNPVVSPTFMQLNKVQQKLDLGNTYNLLHNISQLHMAQQQLVKIKSNQTNSKPGLLGEAPAALLQKALGLGSAPPVNTEMAHWTEAQKATSLTSAPKPAVGMDAVSFFSSQPVTGLPQNKPSTTAAEETISGSQTYFQSFSDFSAGALQSGQPQPPNQLKSTNLSSGAAVNNQTSLLGEPPKDIRLSTNPYLNLASVLPGISLQVPPKAPYAQQQTGVLGSMMDTAVSQESSLQPTLENYCNYFQQYGDYTEEAIKQWYAYYSQEYNTTGAGKQEDGGTEKIGLAEVYQSLPPEDYYNQASAAAYGDFNNYLHVMPSYYTAAQGAQQLASVQSSQQNHFNKQPWSTEKRGSSYLMSSSETNLMDYARQNSQDTGEHYTDSCFKRKRVY